MRGTAAMALNNSRWIMTLCLSFAIVLLAQESPWPVVRVKNDCDRYFCRRIICEPIDECSGGEIVAHGSLCGCCDVCVKRLGEGEACEGYKAPPGGIPKAECKLGLECKLDLECKADTECKVCAIDESEIKCDIVVKWRKKLLEESHHEEVYAKDLWIPDCDEKGLFRAKQCKQKKCFCVNKDGKRIFGQEERHLAANMTCACSRAMSIMQQQKKDSWMTKPQEHCTPSGDYDDLQCVDDLCYCADPATGGVIGKVTAMSFIELLPCYDEEKHTKRYLKQCEIQLMRTRSLIHQFRLKGIEIIGLDSVQCDLDGTFAPKQCQTDVCACTDEKGVSIGSYRIEKTNTDQERQMTCRCARDRNSLHSLYTRMSCEATGNFVPHQCFDGQCYCVDEDGDVFVDYIPINQKVNASGYCQQLLTKLNQASRFFTRDEVTTYEYYDN
uniref:U3-Liphistoxin-Lsp1b_1 n=1 Tax=Liphistius sp. SGP-2016 TaxID=1905180 RepID=A0A4Q8K3G7_9ARAC